MRVRFISSLAGAFVCLFVLAVQPQAAVVNFDGTGVTSIDGLVVGAVTYDIIFTSGSYTSVFGTALFSDATQIAAEINAAFNALATPPLLSANLGIPTLATYFLPLNADSPPLIAITGGTCTTSPFTSAVCTREAWFSSVGGVGSGVTNWTWAVPTVSPVPLPAALPLFLAALGGLSFFGWRRRMRAAV